MTPYELTAEETGPSLDASNAAPVDRSSRRLAVCAAACEGIPTAELESGILVELVAACVRLRDDDRVREVLLRLSPLKTGPVRIVPPAEEIEREREPGMAVPIAGAEVAEEEMEGEPARASDEPSRPRLEVLRPARPPAGTMASPPRRQKACEKFRIGLRVRISPTGFAMMPPTIASPTGVVFGFSRSPYAVRVIRDGRTSSETFDMDFWEEDPDYRDANESIVSGFRAPFRSGTRRREDSAASGVVFLSAVGKNPPRASE